MQILARITSHVASIKGNNTYQFSTAPSSSPSSPPPLSSLSASPLSLLLLSLFSKSFSVFFTHLCTWGSYFFWKRDTMYTPNFLTPTKAELHLRYCESQMCPPNTSLERHLCELQSSGQAQCTTVWTKGTVAYRCRTCQVNDSRLVVIINKHDRIFECCIVLISLWFSSWLPVQLKVWSLMS